MTSLVTIGEFSRLTHLSVKALRHYHAVGVLEPADVDDQNGYRFYSIEQLSDAHLIRRLRDLDMPLEAVRTVVVAQDQAARNAALKEHLQRMEDSLARTQAVVASLRALLEEPVAARSVDVVLLGSQRAVAIVTQLSRSDVEEWSTETFTQLATVVGLAGFEPTGPPGSLFTPAFFEEGIGTVTAFQPVKAQVDATALSRHEAEGWVELDVAGGSYARTSHAGPYVDLDRTYGALGGYVAEHLGTADPDRPIREHYLIGPDDATISADLRTDLLWPTRS